MKHLILLNLLLFLISCSNSKTVEVKDNNGVVIEKYQILEDSTRHGTYETFKSDGAQMEKAVYQNGKLEGQRTLYYADGQVEIEENYVSGIMNGPYKVFHENGQLNVEVHYEDGKMQGLLKRYFDTGTLQEEVTFVDSEENGPFKEYFASGNVEWEGAFLNGDNEEGILIQYNEDGTIKKKMNCSSGICRTIWTEKDGDVNPVELN